MSERAEDVYPMIIEWWETDAGEYNWHAKATNGEILFGSTQGYVDKTYMIQNITIWFPHATIEPADGEPPSSTDVAAEELKSEGQAE